MISAVWVTVFIAFCDVLASRAADVTAFRDVLAIWVTDVIAFCGDSAIWVADVTTFCHLLAIGVTVFIAFCVASGFAAFVRASLWCRDVRYLCARSMRERVQHV